MNKELLFKKVETIIKPVTIKFKREDGSIARFKGTKCVRKPERVIFKKTKKKYKK